MSNELIEKRRAIAIDALHALDVEIDINVDLIHENIDKLSDECLADELHDQLDKCRGYIASAINDLAAARRWLLDALHNRDEDEWGYRVEEDEEEDE